jgi:type I restriction-modification system DNA methylase subunit
METRPGNESRSDKSKRRRKGFSSSNHSRSILTDHPDGLDNHEMGTLFEQLIRRFYEDINQNPGEHFTPIRKVEKRILDMLKEVMG